MTFKMPPFAGVVDKYMNVWTPDGQEPLKDGDKVYTAQALRDVLEQAATKFENMQTEGNAWVSTVAVSALIRAMIKEIEQ